MGGSSSQTPQQAMATGKLSGYMPQNSQSPQTPPLPPYYQPGPQQPAYNYFPSAPVTGPTNPNMIQSPGMPQQQYQQFLTQQNAPFQTASGKLSGGTTASGKLPTARSYSSGGSANSPSPEQVREIIRRIIEG